MTGLPYALTCEITFDPVSDTSPTWVDVTDRLMSFSSFRGQQYDTDGPQPGTLTVVLSDPDAAFDPENTSGPYYGFLRPNRRVRIIAQQTAMSSPVPLAYGYVDSFERRYEHADAQVTISCTDHTKLYARHKISHTLLQDYVGANIDELLNTSASVGGTGLLMAQLACNGWHWDFLSDLARDDGGRFFFDGSGDPVYHVSQYRTSQSVSTTSQATFAYGTTSGIPVEVDLAPGFDDALLANYITVRDAAGGAHVKQNASSQAEYGVLDFEMDTSLMPGGANTRAQSVRIQRMYPRSRVRELRVDALTDADCMTQALGREISDRITLSIGGLGGGTAHSTDYFIDSVAHDVSIAGQQSWVTTWQVNACRSSAGPTTGTAATDDFTRADAASLGTEWMAASMAYPDGSPAVAIVSNKASGVTGTYNDGTTDVPSWFIYDPLSAIGADIDMTVDVTTASAQGILAFRVADDFTSGFLLTTTALKFLSYSGTLSSTTVSTSWASSFSSGNTARVVTSGNSISIYRNGVLLATVSSSSNNGETFHGLGSLANSSAVWDNFDLTVTP